MLLIFFLFASGSRNLERKSDKFRDQDKQETLNVLDTIFSTTVVASDCRKRDGHWVLVIRLEGLSQPSKSVVRFTGRRPNMTVAVFRDKPTSKQKKKQTNKKKKTKTKKQKNNKKKKNKKNNNKQTN